MVKGVDLVEKGNYGQLEKGLKDALLISLYKNLGTEYFLNPKERLEAITSSNGQMSTGWKDLDDKLYGGMNRGELHLFAGGSGTGKSLFLQNLALNFAQSGKNVVYVSLELSEELICMRLDAMLTGMPTKEIFKKIDQVHSTVVLKGKNSGNIWVKEVPQGSTVNQLRSYLKEIEIQTEQRPDILIVDYLDLLHPNDRRIDVQNLFVKDKFISEELRGLAREGLGPDHKFVVITASQFNRSAVEEVDFTHANIAGGKSKIDTSDGAYGIYTSKLMRERGRYQLQMLKLRNSAGTGERIDLGYSVETMRISDIGDDYDDSESSTQEIFQQLKNKSKSVVKKQSDESNEEEKQETKDKKKNTDILTLINQMKQKSNN